MKKVFQILLIVLFSSIAVLGQEIPIPENYTIVDSVSGDLDKDGIKEYVVAFNTKKENDTFESIPRELRIYKKEKENWILWKISGQALYGSQDGGMMGDPFGQIEIKNGILLISQNGGSRFK